MKPCMPTLKLVIALIGCLVLEAVCTEKGETAPVKSGLTPASVRLEAGVTEKQLADLLPRLAKRLSVNSAGALHITKPTAPVTRLRALTALMRVALRPEEAAELRGELPEEMPSDMAQVPQWGRPYVAAAVARGWVHASTPFKPQQTATWRFLEPVLARMVEAQETQGPPVKATEIIIVEGKYSGLIIELGELKVERSMCPRILDEDGEVVYPDPDHLPDIDFVQDHGMLTYDKSLETAKRAGKSPLIVQATGVAGKARTDIVVSKETAEQIREANKSSKFLWKWAVSVLLGSGEPQKYSVEE